MVRAWAPKPSAWMGGEGRPGGFASGSRAEREGHRAAGIDEYDLALLLWQCGVDDPATRSKAWAALMVVGAHAAQHARWPRGRLSGLVDLALAELAQPGQRWTDERRRTWGSLDVSKAGWSQSWGARYRYVLTAAWKGAGRARWLALERGSEPGGKIYF